MKNKKHLSIYEDAVGTFGVKDQLDQAQEEAAELICSISKYSRSLNSRDLSRIEISKSDLLLELADVEIMKRQILIIIGYSDAELEKAIKCKLKKLQKHLELGVK